MVDNIPLSLQALPKTDRTTESLPFLISCINEQRGSFRNVTEESLEAEIRNLEALKSEEVEDSSDDDDVQDEKSRRDQLAPAREDMLRQVTQAHNESAQALDFVSLLLSQHAPQQAQQTLNPYIKNALPLGVLGTGRVQPPQKMDAQKDTDSMMAIGWKMQSLDSAADLLLKSATRLELELERETRYWERVLAVKQQGWSVCRLPREKHTLSVKYGFSEAYADFRDRGISALRRDEDGDVSLDRGARSSDSVIRVQIVQAGKILSSSRVPKCSQAGNRRDGVDDVEDAPIEQQILQARNSIFDEELHSELHREARNLVNQGVRCIGDSIQLPYEGDKQIEIGLIDLEESHIGTVQDDDGIATAISLALRILLSHAHRQNLHRRSQPPPPIVEGKRPRPVYPILKPIIENIRHRSDIQSVKDFLNGLTASLHQAGLQLDIEYPTTSLNVPHNLSISRTGEPALTETLINSLTSPLHTSTSMHLPSRQTSVRIDTHTNLFPATLGTQFRTTITNKPSIYCMSQVPETMQFTTINDLEEHITHLLTLDLVTLMVPSDKEGWEVVNPHIGAVSRTFKGKDGSLGSMVLRVSFDNDRALLLEWQSRKEDETVVENGTRRWKGGEEAETGLMDCVTELTENVG